MGFTGTAPESLDQGFSAWTQADVQGWTVLCRGAVLRIVGCSAAFLVSFPPEVKTKNVSEYCQMSLGSQKSLPFKTTGLDFSGQGLP